MATLVSDMETVGNRISPGRAILLDSLPRETTRRGEGGEGGRLSSHWDHTPDLTSLTGYARAYKGNTRKQPHTPPTLGSRGKGATNTREQNPPRAHKNRQGKVTRKPMHTTLSNHIEHTQIIAPRDQPPLPPRQEPAAPRPSPTGRKQRSKAPAKGKRQETDPCEPIVVPPPITLREARDGAETRLAQAVRAALDVPGAALAGAIRRSLSHVEMADALPDDVLVGLFVAQVVSGLSNLGSTGSTDRAAIWRMLGAVWASPPGGAVSPGGKAPSDPLEPEAVVRAGVVVADALEAAIQRAASRRTVTLEGKAERKPAETRHSKPTVHLLSEQVHDAPTIPTPIRPAPARVQARHMGEWTEDSDPLGRWPD